MSDVLKCSYLLQKQRVSVHMCALWKHFFPFLDLLTTAHCHPLITIKIFSEISSNRFATDSIDYWDSWIFPMWRQESEKSARLWCRRSMRTENAQRRLKRKTVDVQEWSLCGQNWRSWKVRLSVSVKRESEMCDGVRRGDFPAGTFQSVVGKKTFQQMLNSESGGEKNRGCVCPKILQSLQAVSTASCLLLEALLYFIYEEITVSVQLLFFHQKIKKTIRE